MADELPAFLTIEEAARLLRIGRTKAYAMAREWRATGGRSGLPVVDLGNILRVPRPALEELLGGEVDGALVGTQRRSHDKPTIAGERVEPAAPAPIPGPKPKRRATRPVPPGQTTLPLTG